jgi:4-hydroxy-tetrahydrodipicolinate reductase
MQFISVMVNGIPGRVACTVARHVLEDPRFRLIPCSFTGPEIQQNEHAVAGTAIRLIRPDAREPALQELQRVHGSFLSVDYTHPSAVNANVNLPPPSIAVYMHHRETRSWRLCSPSGARWRRLRWADREFPAMMNMRLKAFGPFQWLHLAHPGKRRGGDTSRTVGHSTLLNQPGIPFNEPDRHGARPQIQNPLKIPKAPGRPWVHLHLALRHRPLRFTHNVNGREINPRTLDACAFTPDRRR